MKPIAILIAIAMLVSTAGLARQHDQFSLSGTIKNIKTGKVYLQKYRNKMLLTIDSANVVDGKFTFKTVPQLPELYGIALDPTVDLLYPFYVFLENSPITVYVDSTDSYKHSTVSGSKLHDQYNEYKNNPRGFKIDAFISKYPASIASAYVLYRYYSFRLSPEELEKNIALFDQSMHNTQYYQLLKTLPDILRKNGVGQQSPNWEQWDTKGKSYKLYDHLGKYLFIDFWASWCPPCRAESPALIKLYNKYKGEGLEILGVSFDKKKEPWLKAIKDDKLPWPQVSDLKFWDNEVGKLYGIRLIPSNVLLDPNGIIIARNLHGEELEKKLEQVFGK